MKSRGKNSLSWFQTPIILLTFTHLRVMYIRSLVLPEDGVPVKLMFIASLRRIVGGSHAKKPLKYATLSKLPLYFTVGLLLN